MAVTAVTALMEKLTSETVMEISWDGFVEVADRLKHDISEVKNAITTFKKRLNHRDPHVVQNTIELLDFCWKNGPPQFRKEVSSRKFIEELQSKAKMSEPLISKKMCEKIRDWANGECKQDPSLSLISTLYRELLEEGANFSSSTDGSAAAAEKKRKEALLKEEEERQLKEAIQASLKASTISAMTKVPDNTPIPAQSAKSICEKKVRALYDFPAAEDNEMSFNAGDIITVIDDSNPHWWKARLNGKEGLIPAQFVEDVSIQKPEPVVDAIAPAAVVRIDEVVLQRALDVIHMCDPTGLRSDPADLQDLEAQALGQAPLIDAQLAQIDRLSNMLAKVDMSIRNALAEYDTVVQNYQPPTMMNPYQQPGMPPVGQPQMLQVQQVPAYQSQMGQQVYQGVPAAHLQHPQQTIQQPQMHYQQQSQVTPVSGQWPAHQNAYASLPQNTQY